MYNMVAIYNRMVKEFGSSVQVNMHLIKGNMTLVIEVPTRRTVPTAIAITFITGHQDGNKHVEEQLNVGINRLQKALTGY